MQGRVMHGEPVPERSALLLTETLHQRVATMDIEVVHDQMNGLSNRVCLHHALHPSRDLVAGAIRGGSSEVAAGLGLHHAEYICRAAAFIFVVLLGWLARLDRTRRPHVGVQEYRLLTQTNHGFGWIVGFLINGQRVFHAVDVGTVQLRHAPHFFPATASTRGFAAKSELSLAPPWVPVYVSRPLRLSNGPSSGLDLPAEYCRPWPRYAASGRHRESPPDLAAVARKGLGAGPHRYSDGQSAVSPWV